jgi:hypothetical protein
MSISRRALCFVFLLFPVLFLGGCARIDHVYLTWQHDPRTTMTVNFQSPEHYENLTLAYDTKSHAGDAANYPLSASGTVRQIPGLKDERYIYHIEATDLLPGETYHFVLADGGKSVTKEFRFRPLPAGDAPLRFISGGDMTILPRAHQLTGLAGKNDPMFALIGGDIAYDNGKLGNAWMWDRWFQMWEDNMVTSDGVMVPMVLAIGNHEVNDDVEGTIQERAPFYYGFFAQGGAPNFTRQLRDDTLLIVLDSGHTIEHAAQIPWLEEALKQGQSVKNTIAVYHAPLYPSHRDFEDWRALAGRESWLPLFDLYGLDVSFENHDHSFKRTKVLKGNQVAETGTVYMGDGSFGVNPREAVDPDRWYLEKASGTPHFWLVNIDGEGMHFKAISHAKETLDELTVK